MSLDALGFKNYGEYLGSKLWAKVRAKRWAMLKTKACFFCGEKADQLHHERYDNKTLTGHKMNALTPVCQECHEFGSVDEKGRVVIPQIARCRMIARAEAMGRVPGSSVIRIPRKRRRKKQKKRKDPNSPGMKFEAKKRKEREECRRALEDLRTRQQAPIGRQSARGETDRDRRKRERSRPRRQLSRAAKRSISRRRKRAKKELDDGSGVY